MNLIFALLVTRQFLSKEQIRQSIADYRESSQQAFERKFDRDKDELRELGIAIETGTNDKYFEDEPGYRIRRDVAELPDLDLTREEAAVLGLAAQVWEHSGLASESATALLKLKAAGIQVDTDVLRTAEPRLSASEPAFDTAWEAATRRIPVTFTYARPGGEPMQRHVQPWGIISWNGRWYLGGHDLDRQEPRLFRLSRVAGDVQHDGQPGSYEVPPEASLSDLARALYPPQPDRTAVLDVRAERAQSLRRHATSTTPIDASTDRIELPYSSSRDMAGEIASYGADVVVVGPDDLRERVVARLRAALEVAS